MQAIVLEAPWQTTHQFLECLPERVEAVYHGPVHLSAQEHGYDDVRELVRAIPQHEFDYLNAKTIVERIIERRDEYLERQRKKGVKGDTEAILRAAEVGRTV